MTIPANYLELTTIKDDSSLTLINEGYSRPLPFADSSLKKCKIKHFKILTHGEDVKPKFHIILDYKNDPYKTYLPGNAIGILTENIPEEMSKLAQRLNIGTNDFYKVDVMKDTTKKKAAVPLHIPSSGNIHNTFNTMLDIRSVPKKLFLKSLLPYMTDSIEKERIDTITSPKGSKLYEEFISTEGRTLNGVLEAFPSCNPPIERLFEHLPYLQPRFYSIASSPLQNELHFAFSVPDKVKGVCTDYLQRILKTQEEILIYFRKGNEILESFYTTGTKLIFVGQGAALAPFIGYLKHKELSNSELGASILYFGCRYSNKDFIYKDEIERFKSIGILDEVHTAFSREDKVYVQDLIDENFAKRVVDEGYSVWICGSREMSQNVQKAIITYMAKYDGIGDARAKEYFGEMQKCKRIWIDCWT